MLDHVGLTADLVVGDRFAEGKGEVLREIGAQVYVGDHTGDVVAAIGADAASVAVATGPTSAEDLATAGADVVLASLTELPGWLDEHVLGLRLAALDRSLREIGRRGPLVVAFSGGADSAFVLAAAVRAVGSDRVVAATAVSPSLATGELERAQRVRRTTSGCGTSRPATHELDRDGYVANAGDRCYFCKSELVDVLSALDAVTDGADRRHRHQRRRRPRRLPPRHRRRRPARRHGATARRRPHQGAGPRGVAAMGSVAPGTSRRPPASPAGWPTACR